MNTAQPETPVLEITEFLKTTFESTGFLKAVVGVSGGVDSATTLVLTVRALGIANVYPVLLPYGALSTQGTLDAMNFVQSVGIPIRNIVRIDIRPATDLVVSTSGPADQVRKGNIMARVRMVFLYDQARKRDALVVGTENKTEQLLGYFTRFGDEASDIEPLRHLYKTEVYAIAKHLDIPQTILTKPPSAGLWDGQTDEGEFGFTYGDADRILALVHDGGMSADEAVSAGFDPQTVRRVVDRMEKNRFKHSLPHTL